MKHKKKSSIYPLLFGVAWLIIAFFTKSWEPALIGGIFILKVCTYGGICSRYV